MCCNGEKGCFGENNQELTTENLTWFIFLPPSKWSMINGWETFSRWKSLSAILELFHLKAPSSLSSGLTLCWHVVLHWGWSGTTVCHCWTGWHISSSTPYSESSHFSSIGCSVKKTTTTKVTLSVTVFMYLWTTTTQHQHHPERLQKIKQTLFVLIMLDRINIRCSLLKFF